jgi:C1A family cysteine protease
VLAAPPAAVDLRSCGFPPVRAQGSLNSCTAHVLAALLYHDMCKRCPGEAFEPSRLFIYYNQRDLRREVGNTRYGRRGAPVRMSDCIRSIQATGFCSEAQWAYVEALADVKPAASLYEFAAGRRSYKYFPVAPEIAHLKGCLAEGYPLACGIAMYESFLGPVVRRSGIVSLPAAGEVLRGGHAVAIVGYDDARSHFIARNSFGPQWGDGGHCYLPYGFLADPGRGFDFWIVSSASGLIGGAGESEDSPPTRSAAN